MRIHEFKTELWLPCPVAKIFAFFADAGNLQAITPEWLNFQILTPHPIVLRAGALIDYRLRLHGLPVRWQTEITAWEPPHCFVDKQRRGPFRLWVHEHQFRDHQDGTLCTDHVRYSVPGGELVHRLFVRRDVKRIFQFRQKKLLNVFPGC